jgi:hypothetical protein
VLLVPGAEGVARDRPIKPGIFCYKDKGSRYHVGKIAASHLVGTKARTNEMQERWDEERATS